VRDRPRGLRGSGMLDRPVNRRVWSGHAPHLGARRSPLD
jgi:hypothetical protein